MEVPNNNYYVEEPHKGRDSFLHASGSEPASAAAVSTRNLLQVKHMSIRLNLSFLVQKLPTISCVAATIIIVASPRLGNSVTFTTYELESAAEVWTKMLTSVRSEVNM